MEWAVVDDRVDGVQPQSIEVVLGQPVKGILNEEGANRLRHLAVEVDRWPPWGPVRAREERGTEGRRIRAIGAEVVVHDVEKDRDAASVRLVDEGPEIVRGAVGVRGCEERGAVVSPVPPTWKVRDRHELDGSHPEVAQVGEAAPDTGEGPLRSERPHMEFIENKILQRASVPVLIVPDEPARVDDH